MFNVTTTFPIISINTASQAEFSYNDLFDIAHNNNDIILVGNKLTLQAKFSKTDDSSTNDYSTDLFIELYLPEQLAVSIPDQNNPGEIIESYGAITLQTPLSDWQTSGEAKEIFTITQTETQEHDIALSFDNLNSDVANILSKAWDITTNANGQISVNVQSSDNLSEGGGYHTSLDYDALLAVAYSDPNNGLSFNETTKTFSLSWPLWLSEDPNTPAETLDLNFKLQDFLNVKPSVASTESLLVDNDLITTNIQLSESDNLSEETVIFFQEEMLQGKYIIPSLETGINNPQTLTILQKAFEIVNTTTPDGNRFLLQTKSQGTLDFEKLLALTEVEDSGVSFDSNTSSFTFDFNIGLSFKNPDNFSNIEINDYFATKINFTLNDLFEIKAGDNLETIVLSNNTANLAPQDISNSNQITQLQTIEPGQQIHYNIIDSVGGVLAQHLTLTEENGVTLISKNANFSDIAHLFSLENNFLQDITIQVTESNSGEQLATLNLPIYSAPSDFTTISAPDNITTVGYIHNGYQPPSLHDSNSINFETQIDISNPEVISLFGFDENSQKLIDQNLLKLSINEDGSVNIQQSNQFTVLNGIEKLQFYLQNTLTKAGEAIEISVVPNLGANITTITQNKQTTEVSEDNSSFLEATFDSTILDGHLYSTTNKTFITERFDIIENAAISSIEEILNYFTINVNNNIVSIDYNHQFPIDLSTLSTTDLSNANIEYISHYNYYTIPIYLQVENEEGVESTVATKLKIIPPDSFPANASTIDLGTSGAKATFTNNQTLILNDINDNLNETFTQTLEKNWFSFKDHNIILNFVNDPAETGLNISNNYELFFKNGDTNRFNGNDTIVFANKNSSDNINDLLQEITFEEPSGNFIDLILTFRNSFDINSGFTTIKYNGLTPDRSLTINGETKLVKEHINDIPENSPPEAYLALFEELKTTANFIQFESTTELLDDNTSTSIFTNSETDEIITITDQLSTSNINPLVIDTQDTIKLVYGASIPDVNILNTEISRDIYFTNANQINDNNLNFGTIEIDLAGIHSLEDFSLLLEEVNIDDTNDTISIKYKHNTNEDANSTTLHFQYNTLIQDENSSLDLSNLIPSNPDASISEKLLFLLQVDQNSNEDLIQPILDFKFKEELSINIETQHKFIDGSGEDGAIIILDLSDVSDTSNFEDPNSIISLSHLPQTVQDLFTIDGSTIKTSALGLDYELLTSLSENQFIEIHSVDNTTKHITISAFVTGNLSNTPLNFSFYLTDTAPVVDTTDHSTFPPQADGSIVIQLTDFAESEIQDLLVTTGITDPGENVDHVTVELPDDLSPYLAATTDENGQITITSTPNITYAALTELAESSDTLTFTSTGETSGTVTIEATLKTEHGVKITNVILSLNIKEEPPKIDLDHNNVSDGNTLITGNTLQYQGEQQVFTIDSSQILNTDGNTPSFTISQAASEFLTTTIDASGNIIIKTKPSFDYENLTNNDDVTILPISAGNNTGQITFTGSLGKAGLSETTDIEISFNVDFGLNITLTTADTEGVSEDEATVIGAGVSVEDGVINTNHPLNNLIYLGYASTIDTDSYTYSSETLFSIKPGDFGVGSENFSFANLSGEALDIITNAFTIVEEPNGFSIETKADGEFDIAKLKGYANLEDSGIKFDLENNTFTIDAQIANEDSDGQIFNTQIISFTVQVPEEPPVIYTTPGYPESLDLTNPDIFTILLPGNVDPANLKLANADLTETQLDTFSITPDEATNLITIQYSGVATDLPDSLSLHIYDENGYNDALVINTSAPKTNFHTQSTAVKNTTEGVTAISLLSIPYAIDAQSTKVVLLSDDLSTASGAFSAPVTSENIDTIQNYLANFLTFNLNSYIVPDNGSTKVISDINIIPTGISFLTSFLQGELGLSSGDPVILPLAIYAETNDGERIITYQELLLDTGDQLYGADSIQSTQNIEGAQTILITDEFASDSNNALLFEQDIDTLELNYSSLDTETPTLQDNLFLSTDETHTFYLETIIENPNDLTIGNINLNLEGIASVQDFKTLLENVEVDDASNTITLEFKHVDTDDAQTSTLQFKLAAPDANNDESPDFDPDLSAFIDSTDVTAQDKFDTLTGADADSETDGTQTIFEFDF